MGLDLHAGTPATAEGDWEDGWYAPNLHANWPYIGFRQFRKFLATAEGLSLEGMAGFKGDRAWDTVSTPLKPLLNHSDYDGEMTPEQAAQVWPRLVEIAEEWEGDSALEWDLQSLRDLIELLQGAAKNGWQVLFR